jgi:hypothetical protein
MTPGSLIIVWPKLLRIGYKTHGYLPPARYSRQLLDHVRRRRPAPRFRVVTLVALASGGEIPRAKLRANDRRREGLSGYNQPRLSQQDAISGDNRRRPATAQTHLTSEDHWFELSYFHQALPHDRRGRHRDAHADGPLRPHLGPVAGQVRPCERRGAGAASGRARPGPAAVGRSSRTTAVEARVANKPGGGYVCRRGLRRLGSRSGGG